MPTNKELEQEVKDLRAMIEAQQSTPPPKKTEIEDKPYVRPDRPESGGWFIQTINPEFNGLLCRTRFANGMAIIYTDQEGADETVRSLQADHSCTVIAAEDSELINLQKRIATAKPKEKQLHDKLMRGG